MKRNVILILSSTVAILLLVTMAVVTTIILKQNKSTVGNNASVSQPVAVDANFTEFQKQLAPGFPDFPVYPGAQIIVSRKETKATENKNGYSAEWTANGDKNVTDVANWYTNELVKKGWLKDIGSQENGPAEVALKFTKVGQPAILNIEKGESTNPNDIDILVHIPVDKL
jgi:hypothetical protein